MYEAKGPITNPVDHFKSEAEAGGEWTLLDSFKIQNDNYLWYVLAAKENQGSGVVRTQYVTWMYNGQTPSCFHGHYETDYNKAVADYEKRCGVRLSAQIKLKSSDTVRAIEICAVLSERRRCRIACLDDSSKSAAAIGGIREAKNLVNLGLIAPVEGCSGMFGLTARGRAVAAELHRLGY